MNNCYTAVIGTGTVTGNGNGNGNGDDLLTDCFFFYFFDRLQIAVFLYVLYALCPVLVL